MTTLPIPSALSGPRGAFVRSVCRQPFNHRVCSRGRLEPGRHDSGTALHHNFSPRRAEDQTGFGPKTKTEEPHSVNYSNRSASVGLTADARRAGMSAALSAVEHRTKVAARIVTESVGLTS